MIKEWSWSTLRSYFLWTVSRWLNMFLMTKRYVSSLSTVTRYMPRNWGSSVLPWHVTMCWGEKSRCFSLIKKGIKRTSLSRSSWLLLISWTIKLHLNETSTNIFKKKFDYTVQKTKYLFTYLIILYLLYFTQIACSQMLHRLVLIF